MPRLGVEADLAAHRPNQFRHDGEPEAAAPFPPAPASVDAVEAIEDASLRLLRDAWAEVLYPKHRLDAIAPGPDDHPAAVGAGPAFQPARAARDREGAGRRGAGLLRP